MTKIIKKKKRSTLVFMSFLLMLFFVFSEFTFAAAWWGEGYRKPEWVVKHGGTIINYTIVGANSTKKYKAMMFQNGEYVEVEFGNNATFDDAKNGTYVINFYKCKHSCMDHKYDRKTKIRSSDKLITSITVVARPGQTNNIVFNADAKTAFIASRSGGKPDPVDPFIAQKKAAEKQEGNFYEYGSVHDKNYRFNQMIYLAPNIDFEAFAKANVEAGIAPQFILAKKSAEEQEI